jgi:pimeloyl-ACP methyl ester carboxylesterase
MPPVRLTSMMPSGCGSAQFDEPVDVARWVAGPLHRLDIGPGSVCLGWVHRQGSDVVVQPQRQVVAGGEGVAIAYWVSGRGRPLVLVHGSLGDHTRREPLLPYLEEHVTVYAMDRRGRGASVDGAGYTMEEEYEDVAAVVDAVAASTGQAVAVYGHSYGGICAFGAAVRWPTKLDRLILYEGWPPVDPARFPTPPGLVERMEELLAAGQPDAVIETALRESAGLSEEEIEAYRAQPSWAARVAAAPTYPREERAFDEVRFAAAEAARIGCPTLLLVGSGPASEQWDVGTVAAAIPEARVAVLDGQEHAADVMAPELVAERIVSFVGAGTS